MPGNPLEDLWKWITGGGKPNSGVVNTGTIEPYQPGRTEGIPSVPSLPGSPASPAIGGAPRLGTLRGMAGDLRLSPTAFNMPKLAMDRMPEGSWDAGWLKPPGVVPEAVPVDTGVLPFTNELEGMMGRIENMLKALEGSQVPQYMLETAQNAARQASAVRGIEGPLAASIETAAQAPVIRDWEAQRMDRISNLLQLQGATINWAQMGETSRRQFMAQMLAAEEAARAGDWDTVGSIIGGLTDIAVKYLIPVG